jgi:predicted Fe-S protein YdhL (DUF1289 family)
MAHPVLAIAAGRPHGPAMTDPRPVRPQSPCTGVCAIDPASGLCRGCRRTLAEIAAWSTLGEAERDRVWAALGSRG